MRIRVLKASGIIMQILIMMTEKQAIDFDNIVTKR